MAQIAGEELSAEFTQALNPAAIIDKHQRAKKEFDDLMKRLPVAGWDKKIQVVWTVNKAGNVGTAKGLEQLSEVFPALKESVRSETDVKKSSVQAQTTRLDTLLRWCHKQGYVKHKMTLVNTFGIHVECYAKPYLEHEVNDKVMEKHNILAAILTQSVVGILTYAMIGKAVFIRFNDKGEPVNFDRKEAIRLLLFLNDFRMTDPAQLKVFKMIHPVPDLESALDMQKFCYPYYDGLMGTDTFVPGYGIMSANKDSYVDGRKKKILPQDRPLISSFNIPEDHPVS